MVTTTSRGVPFCGQLGPAEGKLTRTLLGGDAVSIAKAALSVEGVREATIQQLLHCILCWQVFMQVF